MPLSVDVITKNPWMVQGPKGPEPALRPPQSKLDELNDCESFMQRMAAVRNLAQQGYVMDAVIDGWGWPYDMVMALRRQYGYTWVPSALMPNISIAPGLSWPGGLAYDPTPPIGAILVPAA